MLEPAVMYRRRRSFFVWCTVATVGLVVLTSCSSDSTGDKALSSSLSSVAPTTIARPAGPAADVSQELTAGSLFIAEPGGSDLASAGYEQHEYVASGTATSYQAAGALSGDGRWEFTPSAQAPYRTRVLIRRPSDPS